MLDVKPGDIIWFKGDREVPAGPYTVAEYNGRHAIVIEAGPINLWTVSVLECSYNGGEYDANRQ